MKIEICKWYNNAESPVLFLIDDFANVWVDTNGNGQVELGEDWGYAKNSKNSSFRFLNEKILKDFQEVKTIFFVPVGVRIGMIENPPIRSISKMINCDEETKKFFKSVNDNPKYEIAYHGTTHGKVGKTRYDFKQEWELFKSVEEAVSNIVKGKNIYKDVFGEYPKGGKYCGYETNEFSDESIYRTDFLWWCRFWNKGLVNDNKCTIGGKDFNPLTNLDVKTFGENKIIDIPSTLDGGLFTGIFNVNIKTIKGIAKFILKKYLINKKLGEIQYLLENKLVISIQEHISPARDDGRRQSPNIFDDEKSLKFIFDYLKDKNVWYCTGTELAEYYLLRENVKFKIMDKNKFLISFDKKYINKNVSIISNVTSKLLKSPSGEIANINNNYFNIKIEEGVYEFLK